MKVIAENGNEMQDPYTMDWGLLNDSFRSQLHKINYIAKYKRLKQQQSL